MKILRTWSIYCSVVLLFLAFILPCSVQAQPTLVNAVSPDLPEQARGVPIGGALRVFDVLLDQYGTTTLELERFSVFAPDATIEVVDGPSLTVPNVAYFRGAAASEADSIVMLAVPERGKGKVHGIITSASGAWLMESIPGKSGLKTRKVDLKKELAGRTFECGVDALAAPKSATSITGLPAADKAQALGIPVNVQYTAHAIIDTDYEYWQQFWNMPGNTGDPARTAAAALEYLGDLIAYASTAYEREIHTNLRIDYARLFATNSDPYSANTNACGCTGSGKLDEVQDEWDGNPTPRTLVHFISGKSEGCGCAYVGVLCSQASGYGASSSIGTGFNIDNPGFIWEGMVIAHEIGHNFNSPHTHSYCNIPDTSFPDPVDICVTNCLTATPDLPGLDSLNGGITTDHPGTIMSYCHQQGGGYANISHTFGLYHPYGKAPWRVPSRMLAHVLDNTACMSVNYVGSDLRVLKDCKPDDPILVGDTATCTITVENLGPDTALDVVAVDRYLSNGTFSFGTLTAAKGSSAMPAGTCTSTANPQNQAGTVTCNLGDIDSGHSATIKVPVTATTPQNINDRVTVSSDSLDPDMTNNTAEDQVNITEAADIAVTKVCKPDTGPLYAGQTGTCYIYVDNRGPSAAVNVVVTDTHVSNNETFTITSLSAPGYSCTPVIPATGSNVTVTCTRSANMPSGTKDTITVSITSNDQVDVNDTVSVTSSTADPDKSNNNASGKLNFIASADLRIEKTTATAQPWVAGTTNVTYTIVVTNTGPSTAQNVVMEDLLPAGVTVVSVTSSAGPPGSCNTGTPGDPQNPVSCNLGNMPFGNSISVTLIVHITPYYPVDPNGTGSLENDARVYSVTHDPDNSDNSAHHIGSVQGGYTDLSVTKVCKPDTTPLYAGQTGTCYIYVDNLGPSAAQGVVVTDIHVSIGTFTITSLSAPGYSCTPVIPATGSNVTVTCTRSANMPSGTKDTITVSITSNDQVDVNDTATVTSSTADPDTSNNRATGKLTFLGSANLSITKSDAPDPVVAGNNLTYTLTVTNNGPSAAPNVAVKDILPAQVSMVSFTPSQGSCNGGVPGDPLNPLTCKLGTLLSAGSATISVVVKVDPNTLNGTILINNAVVSSDYYDPNNGNNNVTASTTVQGGADLSLTKTDSPDPVKAGENITYTLTANNGGPVVAANVVVEDVLPAGVSLVSVTPTQGSCSGSTTITCNLGNIANLGSATITIMVKVDPGVPDGTKLVNSAKVSSDTPDPNPANNNITAETTVSEASADISLNKSAVTTAIAGTDITYYYEISNAGPSVSRNVTLHDLLPPEVVFLNAYIIPEGGQGGIPSPLSCQLTADTNEILCPLGDIPLTGAEPILVIVNVHIKPDVLDETTIANSASLSTDTYDPNTGNNTDSVDVVVDTEADRAVVKTSDFNTYKPSTIITYTITVTNNGPSDAQDVYFWDFLPPDKYAVYQWNDFGCTYSTGPSRLYCNIGKLALGETETIKVYLLVKGNRGVITNTVNSYSTTTDPNSSNNTSVRKVILEGGLPRGPKK